MVRGPLLLLVAALAGGAAPLASVTAQEAPAAVESTESKEPAPTSGTGADAAAPTTAAPSVDATGLSEKEKALLQKINALKAPRWRPFGACRYDWAGWKLMADGVRTTAVLCGPETEAATAGAAPTASVAVHCDTLKLSVRSGEQPWSSWRLPYAAAESKERGGEDLMVASLCANAKPIPNPQPAPPPAVTPAAKPAAKSTATPASKKPTATSPQKPSATKP
ncbi:MAG: hypothetical protein FJ076_08055 [Cyanobacteria bacterium K_DeepCast_35m_m1_288]|nr:hypothetical protein [Cyanobacteria bacterium K_DeepCast_35m_m1_288]